MKFLLKAFAIFAAFIFLVTLSFMLLKNGNVSPERPLNFLEILNDANQMKVSAVGLGKSERSKMIDGRLYRNFVQLLHTGRVVESMQDTFVTDCRVGVELTLFRDTLELGKFRIADRIGRDSIPGIWTPQNLSKINRFLKDVGVPFMACKTERPAASGQKQIFTMPQNPLERRRRKALDSAGPISNVESVSLSDAIDSVRPLVAQALDDLDGLIFPADTAIGEPLYRMVSASDSVEISFVRKACDGKNRETSRPIFLNKEQINKLESLLKDASVETYAGVSANPARGTIRLYKNSRETLSLSIVGKEFGFLEKHQKGADFEKGGFWFKHEPRELNNLLEPLESAAFVPCGENEMKQ